MGMMKDRADRYAKASVTGIAMMAVFFGKWGNCI
jgi:hypothetical protein